MATKTLVPVRFKWPGDGNHHQVLLCGSFHGWQRKILLEKVQGDGFETLLSLEAGKYQYKYIVDGEWMYSSKEPQQDDKHGSFNNVIIVPSAGDSDVEDSDGELFYNAEEDPGPLMENGLETGDIQCHNFFAVRLQITIHSDHSFEIKMKEGSTDKTVDAYLHVEGCQADASIQATAKQILEEYDAIEASLMFTGEAKLLFSVVFYSEDCLQTFVKKQEEIEEALAKHYMEELISCPKKLLVPLPTSQIPNQCLDLQCKLEVFLAEETPGEEYPTDMKKVTSINVSNFVKKWPCNTAEEVKFHEVHKECMGVVDWFGLGVQLKIPETTLQEIDQDNPKIKGKRLEMLMEWSKLETLTWGKLIQALINIGERTAAESIAKIRGVPFPANLKPCTYESRRPPPSDHCSSSGGSDFQTIIHNLHSQEKELYRYGSQMLRLTEERNELKQLLKMSFKMRDYLRNKDMDNEEEIARLEDRLKKKEEEISLAREKFLSLCREMLRKLKGLVRASSETSDEEYHDDDVKITPVTSAKQLEIQRIKVEVKHLSKTIDGNQDEIETLFNQVECSIATMGDVEFSMKSDRLIMLLKDTIPMKDELRVLIQKKIDAEKELKEAIDLLKHVEQQKSDKVQQITDELKQRNASIARELNEMVRQYRVNHHKRLCEIDRWLQQQIYYDYSIMDDRQHFRETVTNFTHSIFEKTNYLTDAMLRVSTDHISAQTEHYIRIYRDV